MDLILAMTTFLMQFIIWFGPVFLIGFGIWLILRSPKVTPEKRRNRAIRWLGIFAIAVGFLVIAMDLGWIK
jgi:arginine exporter protein ArgO